MSEKRPISELRDSGLLWLINTTVFHPRGFALGLVVDDGGEGEVTGWELLGDGTEPWTFGLDPLTQERVHECFANVEALFDSHRAET